MKPIIFSGIDMIKIDRFSQLDPAIRKRFFTRGIGPISWQEITISHTPENQPKVTLLSKAQEKAKTLHIRQWSISITHTKKTAAAIAVAAADNGIG